MGPDGAGGDAGFGGDFVDREAGSEVDGVGRGLWRREDGGALDSRFKGFVEGESGFMRVLSDQREELFSELGRATISDARERP